MKKYIIALVLMITLQGCEEEFPVSGWDALWYAFCIFLLGLFVILSKRR